MRMIGLDISKNRTGVAIGDGSNAPHTFHFTSKGPKLGDVGKNFAKWFRDFCIVEKPDFCCIEASFVADTDDLYNAQLALGLNFTAQTVCSMRNIPCETVAVQTWRKAFLGTGRPHLPKKAAIQMCKTLGWDVDGNHDEAEAAGIWTWGHIYHGNSKAIMQQLSHGSVRRMAS